MDDIDDSRTDPDPRLEDRAQDIKMANTDEPKGRYKSWRKKYRKLRHKYHNMIWQGEGLRRQELKGIETVKRIALENDCLLEVLQRINECPQIPIDKRIEISPKGKGKALDETDTAMRPTKSLHELERTTPHMSLSVAKAKGLTADFEFPCPLVNADPNARPASFVNADDLENMIFKQDPNSKRPTLAPLALLAQLSTAESEQLLIQASGANGHHGTHPPPMPNDAVSYSSTVYHAHNPTTVYNWLRRHHPQVFLQDAERGKEPGKEETIEKPAKSKVAPIKNGRASGAAAKRPSKGTAVAATATEDDAGEDGGEPSASPPAPARNKRKRVTANLASVEDDNEDSGGGVSSTAPAPKTTSRAKKPRKSDRSAINDDTPPAAKRARKSKTTVAAAQLEFVDDSMVSDGKTTS